MLQIHNQESIKRKKKKITGFYLLRQLKNNQIDKGGQLIVTTVRVSRDSGDVLCVNSLNGVRW